MLRTRSVTSGAQRLARLLLDLAARHGTQTDREVHVVMPLTQVELASMAGMSRATVTRALSDWRRRGIILTGQRWTSPSPTFGTPANAPSLSCAARDVNGHERAVFQVVDAVVPVTDDRLVEGV